MTTRIRRRLALLAVLVLVLLTGTASPAEAAVSHQLIEGTGSSWSQIALSTWISYVKSTAGLQVSFTGTGSAQGRKDFANGTTDFGVSDIAYQGADPISGEKDSSDRPYVYLPIVAGGTAFPYNIKVAGKRVTNLRLRGETLAKIFTNKITNWNDPQITGDNNNHALPSIPIIPVVHSEGSGSTAQFTTYLSKQYGSIWTPFNKGNPSFTEYFRSQGSQVGQNGSDGVMNYVTSAAANGAIGYDEYSFALQAHFPVVKLGNAAGYYTLPDQYNVAKSLTQAEINTESTSQNYLTQKLDRVYVYDDPRTYPLSSYSYMILPISPTDNRMKNATPKRQTLVDFTFYAICGGQAAIGPIGYSSLPYNLVKAGFEQVAKLRTADPGVVLDNRNPGTCDNPTFDKNDLSKNRLAEIAPMPAACDKQGAGPCTDAAGGGSATGAGSGGSGSGAGAGPAASGNANPSASATVQIDPDTGQIVGAGNAAAAGADAQGVPTELAGARSSGLSGVLAWLAFLEVIAVLAIPALLGRWLARRRGGGLP